MISDLSEIPPPGTGSLLASIDVEWSKNFRIKGGNVPFCYSIVWMRMPAEPIDLTEITFSYVSRYVSSAEETQDLIAAADSDFAHVLDTAHLITGHQFSSDLATLINAARQPVPHLHAMRKRWRGRRAPGAPPLLDTRYDLDHLLTSTSRRLVDVCTEFCLDVTQPELRGTSMTSLHRRWINDGDHQARERITVLNLRHGLSTGLLALLSAYPGLRGGVVNVNRLLYTHLTGYTWMDSPTFTDLL